MPTIISASDAGDYTVRLSRRLDPFGFECHPFQVGWYNRRVGAKFALPHDDACLAVVVLSRPDMFENAFLPYLAAAAAATTGAAAKREEEEANRDPLDECMRQTMREAREDVFGGDTEDEVDIIHDFELLPNRRPKIIAQTAAHVSGAVRLFQKCDVKDQTLFDPVKSPKVFPVCLHPKFGGWFAIRCVFILINVQVKDWPEPLPCSISFTEEEIAQLLLLYNDRWRDNSYRDFGIRPEAAYSDAQKEYFATSPADRGKLLRDKNLV